MGDGGWLGDLVGGAADGDGGRAGAHGGVAGDLLGCLVDSWHGGNRGGDGAWAVGDGKDGGGLYGVGLLLVGVGRRAWADLGEGGHNLGGVAWLGVVVGHGSGGHWHRAGVAGWGSVAGWGGVAGGSIA